MSLHHDIPSKDDGIIIDANYTFEGAIAGTKAPPSIISQLALVEVVYYGFDQKLHQGQLVVNKKWEQDVKQIFASIKEHRFPIARVIPIVKYNWDDEASMKDNNTSSFNFRYITGGKKMSKHSTGDAIDFNPKQNPYIKGNIIQPSNGHYDTTVLGTIHHDMFLYELCKKLGWIWGGDWTSLKDYQHFEK